MKSLWTFLGRVGGVMTWPLVWVVIRYTTRSRVLIICGDEVLLLKGWLSTGRWGLPGGGIRRGEDPVEAVLRETK